MAFHLEVVAGKPVQHYKAFSVFQGWEEIINSCNKHISTLTKVPNLDDLFAYTQSLEHTLPNFSLPPTSTPRSATSTSSAARSTSSTTASTELNCPLCSEVHQLNGCPVYLCHDVNRRKKLVKSKKACSNCLSMTHQQQSCMSSYNCKRCNGRHHISLHVDNTPATS